MTNDTSRVLALKYRPRRFEDLIGQSTISQTLSLALDSKRLSHAYLLSGLRGSGKTSTARIMAKSLLCDTGPTSKPCEVCSNCIGANENRHLDIIEMDAASNRGIDDIKDLIEHTKYKPNSGRYKVFIIDEVHMLTPQAFNALLKTLEEPPGFVKFILATTDPLKLPATILSRTQHFRFKRISDIDVMHHLSHILHQEQIEFEKEALAILTRSGQGSLRDTLTLLDQAIIFSKGKISTVGVTQMLGLLDPKVLSQLFDIVLSGGDFRGMLSMLQEYEAALVIDEMTIYLKERMLQHDPKFDILLYDRFFRIFADAKHLLSLNSDSGFVLILMLSKMVEATKLKAIDEVIDQIHTMQATAAPKVQAPIVHNTIAQQEVIIDNNPIEEHIVQPIVEEVAQIDQGEVLYKTLIEKIYEKNHDLGECFEHNFLYNSYQNNCLTIDTYAQGNCRDLLKKFWPNIKMIIVEVYNEDIEIKFEKKQRVEEPKPSEPNITPAQNPQVPQENEDFSSGSMIEEIEMQSSGCVASMGDVIENKQNLAQQELQMEDILNSKMLNKAKELFDPRGMTIRTRS